jgi:hypothetical protein
VWSLGLTGFHAVFSIAIPVCLVGLMFPHRRGIRWAPTWLLVVLGVLLAADVALGYAFAGADAAAGRGPYRPPMLQYVLCAVLVAALVTAGLVWPRRKRLPRPGPANRPAARHVWFVLTGFGASLAFFVVLYAPPNLNVAGLRPHPLTAMALLAAVPAVAGLAVWRLSRGGRGWTDGRLLALLAGAQGPFILLAPLVELDPNRADNPAGMSLVGLAFLAFHLALAWRVWRRSRLAGAA